MTPCWETNQGPARLRVLNTKKPTRIGTWNILTLFQAGKSAIVANEMSRYKIEILGMTEVRWDNFGESKLQSGHTILYSGHQTTQPVHTHGVAFLLSKHARQSLIRWEPHGHRLMEATFKTNQKRISLRIILGYAPTENASEEEKDEFYNKLEAVYRKKHSDKDMTLVMGDFNAKVGADNQGKEDFMGKHGAGDMNENGELFTEFCQQNNLIIGGTLFPHKTIHKTTWTSPDGQTKNQIDHICINKRFRHSLLDVRALRGADAATDHELLLGKIQLKLKRMPSKKSARIKFNTKKLSNSNNLEEFKLELRNRFDTLQTMQESENENINETWQTFKEVYLETSKTVLGPMKQENKPWISDDSLALVEARREIKEKLLAEPNDIQLKEEYRQKNKVIKKSIKKDKRQYIEDLATEAEEAARTNNIRELYQITSKLSEKKGRSANMPIRDKDNNIINDPQETEKRWIEHFSSILNRPPPDQEVNIPPMSPRLEINTDLPTLHETREAIKSLKNNKSAGPDNIVAEMLKADIESAAENLLPIIHKIWQQEEFPTDWKNGYIAVLPKKGNLSDCNNYRGIMLLSIPGKVLSRIILNRIKAKVDKKLRDNQAGFRKNRSCADQISSLRIILEQSAELNTSLYANFIDYSKAFDSIDRNTLWKIMANYGIPDKLINLIKSMYKDSGGQILHKGKLTDFFAIVTGVRQGCLISPFLFLLAIDWILTRSTGDNTGIQWTLNSQLDDLDYADDLALLSHTRAQMQTKTDKLCENSAMVGLQVNIAKTKVMKSNTTSTEPIQIGNTQLEEVGKFVYLGSTVTQTGGTDEDVKARIYKARHTFANLHKVWSSKNIRVNTKLKIFNSNVKSILLYGSETWFLTKKLESKLQTFINKCLRRILNIFWPEVISNQSLWERTKQPRISQQIKQRKFRWLGHTLRKDNDSIAKYALKWNPQGKRKRGRPKTTWRRQLTKELEALRLTLRGAESLAQDRRAWRNLVGGLCFATE